MSADDLEERVAKVVALRAADHDKAAMTRALSDAVVIAEATHPRWIAAEEFVAHVLDLTSAPEAADASVVPTERIVMTHAADLYLACACAKGIAEAIRTFESEHLARVGDFVARIDARPAFADEVRQVLRVKLLAGDAETPPLVTRFAGRGPIGGWVRVAAVRVAHDLVRATARAGEIARDLDDDALDAASPELEIMKQRYGAIVSDAFRVAMRALDAEERGILRMHYVDGRTLEEVAAAYRVSRATAARHLARARDNLVEAVKAELGERIGVESREADSLLEFVRSRIELTLRTLP